MQNQDQRNDAERLREQIVREGKPTRSLASDDHAEQQKDRQRRNAEAAGSFAGNDAQDHERGDGDEVRRQGLHGGVGWRPIVARERGVPAEHHCSTADS